jgi:hypothetical protein
MSIVNGETVFVLSRPVKYSRGGNSQIEGTIVTLREPGMEHSKFYLKLRQMLTRCQMEFAKQAEELKAFGDQQKALHEDTDRIENETEDMIDTFLTLLMASETVDVSQFVETFYKMVTMSSCKAVCLFDDIQPMTSALWDKLYPEDAFKMAVRWCVFFGMPSDGQGKIISGLPSDSPTGPTAA